MRKAHFEDGNWLRKSLEVEGTIGEKGHSNGRFHVGLPCVTMSSARAPGTLCRSRNRAMRSGYGAAIVRSKGSDHRL